MTMTIVRLVQFYQLSSLRTSRSFRAPAVFQTKTSAGCCKSLSSKQFSTFKVPTRREMKRRSDDNSEQRQMAEKIEFRNEKKSLTFDPLSTTFTRSGCKNIG